jgi:pimeloyl-ACP methyl ester carboxylesterase
VPPPRRENVVPQYGDRDTDNLPDRESDQSRQPDVRIEYLSQPEADSDKCYDPRDERVRSYISETMSAFGPEEYNKVLEAVYGLRMIGLEAICVPTLVLNRKFESRSVFRHTEELERRIPDVETRVIPGAEHTSNMENPEAFN